MDPVYIMDTQRVDSEKCSIVFISHNGILSHQIINLYVEIYLYIKIHRTYLPVFISGAVTVLSQLRMWWSSVQGRLCLSHFGKVSRTASLAIFSTVVASENSWFHVLWVFGFQFIDHFSSCSIFWNANLQVMQCTIRILYCQYSERKCVTSPTGHLLAPSC